MKIIDMYRIPGTTGKIKATFNIDFGIMIVRDCKLIEGANGLWAAMPNRSYMQNGMKKFAGIVQIKDTKIMDVISNAAREVYGRQGKESDEIALRN